MAIFEYLKTQVHAGNGLIFFSWCHIVEAMRYDNEHKELLEPYCTAVDTLTQGNCILYPDELTQRELALFLGNHFRFNTSVKADYAYGKFKDALIVSGDWLPTDTGRQMLKDSIAKLPLTGQLRKVFYRKYSKPNNLKKLIRAGSDESLQVIRSKYPGMENLSNDEMIDIFIGTPDKRREVFGRLFNEIFKFKNLLPYSYLFPDLKKLGDFSKPAAEKLLPLIKQSQLLKTILDKSVINEFKLEKQLRTHYVERLIKEAEGIAREHSLNIEEVRSTIIQSSIESVPSIHAGIIAAVEYSKRHKGDTETGRKPHESDVMDIHHLRNLPYVDVYVTDRFFAEVGRTAQQIFNTRVLRSLADLRTYLASHRELAPRGQLR